MFDSRKNCWMIGKYTWKGGWARFGAGWYITKEDAEKKLDQIIAKFPKMYAKD